MLQTLYYPVFRLKKLPPALGLSVGALLGLLLAVFVIEQRADQQTAQLLNEYGQSLASLTSARAIDSAASHDLVSLHAVLQELLLEPRVVFASVHDLNQRLLVQAGEPFWVGSTLEFTSAISLQGDYVGRVNVVLSASFQGESAVRWAIAGVTLLLLLMATLALYDSYGVAWWLQKRVLQRSEPPKSDQGKEEHGGVKASGRAYVGVDETLMGESESLDALDDASGDMAPAVSFLQIQAINGKALKQQLSGDLFSSIMADFNAGLTRVLTLYGGTLVSVGEDGVSPVPAPITEADVVSGMSLAFYADGGDADEAQFQSLCAAYLLQSLTDKNKFRFKLSVLATAHIDSECTYDEGVFCTLGENSILSERVDVQPLNDHLWRVLSLKESFAYLVEHQKVRLKEVAPTE